MGGFGVPFQAQSRASLKAQATPPSGQSGENIWHDLYDTLTFTSAATTNLTFYGTANVGNINLTNLDVGGQLPSPQILKVYNICCDVITGAGAAGVTKSAGTVLGGLNDTWLLLLGGLPVWTFTISNKQYGPYPLSTLHGTGGPQGALAVADPAADSQQIGFNNLTPGWNYYGRIIIPEQTSFKVRVDWNGTLTLTANAIIRMHLMGVLSRRVL